MAGYPEQSESLIDETALRNRDMRTIYETLKECSDWDFARRIRYLCEAFHLSEQRVKNILFNENKTKAVDTLDG